jgi:Na+-transporting NADH:ubiquinone oxidoreductase subunit NqrC
MRFYYLSVLLAAFFHNKFLFKPLKKSLDTMDAVILQIPGLRLWAWMFTFELVKD